MRSCSYIRATCESVSWTLINPRNGYPPGNRDDQTSHKHMHCTTHDWRKWCCPRTTIGWRFTNLAHRLAQSRTSASPPASTSINHRLLGLLRKCSTASRFPATPVTLNMLLTKWPTCILLALMGRSILRSSITVVRSTLLFTSHIQQTHHHRHRHRHLRRRTAQCRKLQLPLFSLTNSGGSEGASRRCLAAALFGGFIRAVVVWVLSI